MREIQRKDRMKRQVYQLSIIKERYCLLIPEHFIRVLYTAGLWWCGAHC